VATLLAGKKIAAVATFCHSSTRGKGGKVQPFRLTQKQLRGIASASCVRDAPLLSSRGYGRQAYSSRCIIACGEHAFRFEPINKPGFGE
jgi:hypothetical protein